MTPNKTGSPAARGGHRAGQPILEVEGAVQASCPWGSSHSRPAARGPPETKWNF